MFSVFPAWLAWGGAAALAGLLFLLQLLRVRPRVVVLPSAVLWRIAASQARPRALLRRFHHLLAYLLSLALVLALWFAAAGATLTSSTDGGRHVFYLDNSVLLTPGDRLAQAKRALLADVARVPAARREVVLGDTVGARLLAPGEDVSLLERRLSAVEADARPSSFPAWMSLGSSPGSSSAPSRAPSQGPSSAPLADRGPAGATPLHLHYYGAWPAAAPLATRRIDGVTLAMGYLAPALPHNRGIVGLGVWPARSGQWGRVDLLLSTAASEGAAPAPTDLSFTLDGRPFDATTLEASGSGTWLMRDVAADGRTLRVALRQGDAFAADDAASLVLPLMRRTAVAVGAGVPAAITEVIRRDPGLELVDDAHADVLVRGPGDQAATNKPTWRLTAARDQTSAFLVTRPGRVAQDLTVDVAALGLSGLDAGPLADRLDRGIGVEIAQGARREVAVWSELLADDVGFTRSATLPLFVSRSLRWLSSPPPWNSHARAGHDLTLDAWSGAGGRPLAVSLLDAEQSLAVAQPTPGAVAAGADEQGPAAALRWGAGWGMSELLLVLAALLLVVEWHAVRRGRMP